MSDLGQGVGKVRVRTGLESGGIRHKCRSSPRLLNRSVSCPIGSTVNHSPDYDRRLWAILGHVWAMADSCIKGAISGDIGIRSPRKWLLQLNCKCNSVASAAAGRPKTIIANGLY